MAELMVTCLLQNPLGQVAPAGHPGDIIRVSDGTAMIYLEPDEFDDLSEELLREMLSRVMVPRVIVPRTTVPDGRISG